MKSNLDEFYPAALTIAGSDSGGGAGIQADLRTFNAAGVFGCSVITAVTAQNPRQVSYVEVMPPKVVAAQIKAVLGTLAVRAVKTGMLGNAEVVHTVAKELQNCKLPLIVDPVMISTSGKELLDASGREALKNELLVAADLITPNLPEAEWLLKRKLSNQSDYVDAALQLAENYNCNVLLKTGHAMTGKQASDIAVINQKVWSFSSPRLEDLSEFASHGTGCTLSAGITAMISLGNSWKDAIRAAKAHVYGALCETALIGRELEGMYPPLEDYSSQISVRCLSKDRSENKR